jgi:hypothetical protein
MLTTVAPNLTGKMRGGNLIALGKVGVTAHLAKSDCTSRSTSWRVA